MIVYGLVRQVVSRWDAKLTIRQKVPLTAPGMVALGLGVSEAAKPTSSVPEKEKAANEIIRRHLIGGCSALTGDKHSTDTLKTIGKWTRVMPKFASDIMVVIPALRSTTRDKHTGDPLMECTGRKTGEITHIPMITNMTTTKSLRHDDQNSSSAKPRVPNILAIT
jgi:hypothetical protein